ncbi:MAG: hypothetical protein HC860_22830, partial [Alkalinema sp. RU_4_3]|nr:hypothetical protein [Alkalinema sp. RU_4_3]
MKSLIKLGMNGPLNPPILGDFEANLVRKSPRIGGLGGALTIATLLFVTTATHPSPAQAQSLSWGDIIKWLSPKRIAGGSRSPLCIPNRGEQATVLTVRPTILWQGNVGAIGLRRAKEEKVFWLQSVSASPGLQSLRYGGPSLEPGQTYDWVFFDDAKGKNPLTWQTIAIAPKSTMNRILSDLNKLPGSGEAKTMARVNYLVQEKMLSDAASEVLAVRSPSKELKQALKAFGNGCG